MFALTGDAPEAAELFSHAAILLGCQDPRAFVAARGAALLCQNRVGQILCALQALAAATVLRDQIPDQVVIAGYSVGEMAAWGVAGVFTPIDTLDLIALRAETMDAATSPGDGLLFVRGLSRDATNSLCKRHNGAIAIVVPDDGFVLGGSRTTLDALTDAARAMNAPKIFRLPVDVASHTKLLAKATAEFREHLRHFPMRFPARSGTRLLSGVDGSPAVHVEAALDKLAAQISQTVRWTDCLQGCIEAGATAFLELGPGHALSEMVARVHPNVATRSIEEFMTPQGVRSWLARNARAR